MTTRSNFSPEVRECEARMASGHRADYGSEAQDQPPFAAEHPSGPKPTAPRTKFAKVVLGHI
jgi:hypothetical protein